MSNRTKLIALAAANGMAMLLALGGCGGDHDLIGNPKYTYAQFETPNGDIIQGELESWSNQHDTVVHLVMKDGGLYQVDSNNVVLSRTPFEEDDR